MPRGHSSDGGLISGIGKVQKHKEKVRITQKSLDRHTPLPLSENFISKTEPR